MTAEYKELTLAIFLLQIIYKSSEYKTNFCNIHQKNNICHVDYALFKADKASLVVAEITASEAFGK